MANSGIVWPALAPKPASKWLWSPLVDTMVIAGVASFLLAAICVPVALAFPASNMLILTAFLHVGVLCNYPHYASTYHIIYRERAAKPAAWRFLLASIPFALVVFAVGVAYPVLLGPYVRVYLTWSAWHYSAQHFGIASMYYARDGRSLNDREKRLVQIAFVTVAFSMMLVANTTNASGADNPFGGAQYGTAIALLPEGAYWVSLGSALLSVVPLLMAGKLIRARTGRPLDRTTWLLYGTNFGWFVLPYLRLPGQHGPWMGHLAMWVVFLIPFFHCAQYLAVTSWRARTTGAVRPILMFSALVALGLALFEGWTALVPKLSKLTYEEALMLVPPILNVHHFIVDGTIWKRPKKKAAAPPAAAAPPMAKAA